MLLNGGERFADARSELAGHLTQDIQHIFFPSGLDQVVIEDFSSPGGLPPRFADFDKGRMMARLRAVGAAWSVWPAVEG